MTFHFYRRFATTAVLAALALPVLAQQPPATTTTPEGRHQAGGHHYGHKSGMGAMNPGDRAQYRAKRMAALKDQLKLTAAQEAAWTTFTTAMQPGDRTARIDRKDMDQLTTPERIDRMRALRTQRAAEADRRGEATKTFYAALSPEQRKTFDTTPHRGHRMGGMGMKEAGDHHHGHRARAEGKPAAAATPGMTK